MKLDLAGIIYYQCQDCEVSGAVNRDHTPTCWSCGQPLPTGYPIAVTGARMIYSD